MFWQNSAIQAVPSACSRYPPVGSGALRSNTPMLSRPRNPPSNTFLPKRSLRLAGVSFIFGANGLGFLLMFFAVLQWKRIKVQSSLPLENFFESLTTAIRYVRYTPGIKILLARHAIFSFFISIIPSLMPVVGLKELHLPASHLGFLFTSMAVGSVISGAFVIPWARARYSPQRI